MDANARDQKFPAAKVFCNPDVLAVLQNSPFRPFQDSKTLVDLKLRISAEKAVSCIANFPSDPTKAQYNALLRTIFEVPNNEKAVFTEYMHHTTPTDLTYQPPKFLLCIVDLNPSLLAFFKDMKFRWKTLCRSFEDSDPQFYTTNTSIIPFPHPFFIPGGRFRECYYWDSFWIIKGLIASDMLQSAKDAARNLLYLVKTLGFVPNGNRVYYLNRSQPPVLTQAVDAIYNSIDTQQERVAWLKECVPLLDREYEWFESRHSISALFPSLASNERYLSMYTVNTSHPRPESFREDTLAADGFTEAATNGKRKRMKEKLFQHVAAAAESGWDFSSRWFGTHGESPQIPRAANIIPTCLNAILLKNERTLARFHKELAEFPLVDNTNENDRNMHIDMLEKYQTLSSKREESIKKLLWDSEKCFWFDLDFQNDQRTTIVSAAGIMPAWAGCFNDWTHDVAKRFVNFVVETSGLFNKGGLACTTQESDQQWDFPNCWPPLVDLTVEALNMIDSRFPEIGAKEAAEELAVRFLLTAHAGWSRDGGTMHEKYDCRYVTGDRGTGGEYEPQTGFGWTNGTVLWLGKQYFKQFSKML